MTVSEVRDRNVELGLPPDSSVSIVSVNEDSSVRVSLECSVKPVDVPEALASWKRLGFDNVMVSFPKYVEV